jgi:hypothetical protein
MDIRSSRRNVGQLVSVTEFDQEVPAEQVGQTRTVLDRGMILDWPGWLKFGAEEEFTDLCEWCPVLQGDRGKASHHVVQGDGLGGTSLAFDPEEEFRWGRIVMNGNVECAAGDPNFLGDVVAAIGK